MVASSEIITSKGCAGRGPQEQSQQAGEVWRGQEVRGAPPGIHGHTVRDKKESGPPRPARKKEWERDDEEQRIWSPEELVQFGIEDSPAFAPGTEFQYFNTNTVLLGLVLQQATGKPLGDLYREQIIEPLGLRRTSFPDAEDSSLPDPHAQGYTIQGQDDGEPGNATNWNPSCGWAAGAMISTVDDLLVYGRALATGEGLLPPEQQLSVIPSLKQSEKDTGCDPEDTLSYWLPPDIHEADRFLSPASASHRGWR